MGQKKLPAREEAIANRKATYFTGRSCKHGHVSERNTVDSSCVACRTAFRESYRDQARGYAQKRRDAKLREDPEGTRRHAAEWQREERSRNPEKFRLRERRLSRKYRKLYPKRKLADCRRRQCAKIQRTPAWVEHAAIRAIYEARPAGHQVDHIVPLRGINVCGLHVPWNLQYLTPAENLRKGNRL